MPMTEVSAAVHCLSASLEKDGITLTAEQCETLCAMWERCLARVMSDDQGAWDAAIVRVADLASLVVGGEQAALVKVDE